jgi:hypothetical protein
MCNIPSRQLLAPFPMKTADPACIRRLTDSLPHTSDNALHCKSVQRFWHLVAGRGKSCLSSCPRWADGTAGHEGLMQPYA